MKKSELKQLIREEIRKVLNTLHENFIPFSDLEDAIKKHKEGNDYYNETKLKNMFNQLEKNDQEEARKKYKQYFPINKINLEKYKIGDITPYGEQVRSFQIRVTNNGQTISLSTLTFSEAKSIANMLNKNGFEAKASQVKGTYYDGFLDIVNPIAHDNLIRMAAIIEDTIGHIIVNEKNERIREKGRI